MKFDDSPIHPPIGPTFCAAARPPARAPLAAVTGPGVPDWSRPMAGGPIGPALDPWAVDSVLGASPGSLFETEATILPVRRAMSRPAASSLLTPAPAIQEGIAAARLKAGERPREGMESPR